MKSVWRVGTLGDKEESMRISRTALAVTALGLSLALGGCGEDATGPNGTEGAIVVTLDMTGNLPDPDGCTVGVDGGTTQPIAGGGRVSFDGLAPGSHVVMLAGIEAYCTLSGDNPLVVQTTAGDTTDVQFHLTCGNATPVFDLAGMEVLGSGYNIGGNYADVADVRAGILDLTALQNDGLLRQVQYERASYHVVSGETSRDYLSNLQVRVGVSGGGFGFSGALKVGFSRERYESQHYSFATVQSVIRKHGLRVALSVPPDVLRDYLSPAAAAAINDPAVDPLDLFDAFGTHVLKGIIVGGRLDFTTSANMSFEKQGRTIDVYARASFKSLFASASIETQVIDQQSQSEFSATEEVHLEVYGGRSEYGQYIVNEGQYEAWVESVDGHSVFMDFESNGLLGMWQLADDADRRTALKAAFDDYAAAHGISLTAAGTIFSNFADTDEGWVYHDTAGVAHTPDHGVNGGFFGGYIVGHEGAEATDEFMKGLDFSASSKFLGNKSPYAGGTLEYYLWYPTWMDTYTWHASIANFVVLISENGNLEYRPANSDRVPDPRFRPGNRFPHYAPTQFVINLVAGEHTGDDGTVPGMWFRWDGDPATESDIWMSMANIRAIKIWGDFYRAEDHVVLDKVALIAP
jgi:hypothetical protein